MGGKIAGGWQREAERQGRGRGEPRVPEWKKEVKVL